MITEPSTMSGGHRASNPSIGPITEQRVGYRQTVIIRPTARLDVMTAPQFRQQISEYLAGGTSHFIVDLSETPGIDGAGMAALVSLFTRVRRQGGTVKLIRSDAPAIQRMLRLTQLDHFFDVAERQL